MANLRCSAAEESEDTLNAFTSLTPLEAPWRNGKTERAGKDWKEDYYKTTQDGPEAQTWTDFEEDCDAVNQTRASKNNDSGYSAHQRAFGKNLPQMEDAILECGGADQVVVSRQQAVLLAQERSMTLGRLALQAFLALAHKRRWKRAPAPCCETLQGRTACWTTPLFLATWSECSQETSKRFLAPERGHQQHVGHSLDSLPRFRSQVFKIPGATVSRR